MQPRPSTIQLEAVRRPGEEVVRVSEQLEDIRVRLEAIAEELADLALDRLHESLAEGTGTSEERRVTKARRAVERAAGILSRDPDPDRDDP